MRVQEDTRQCVVFLCDENKTFVGTGFFVIVPSKSNPSSSFLNIVTAKHVAEKVDGKSFFARVNNKQGSFEYLKGEVTKWFYHPTDNSVDVAVAPFWLTPDVEYKTIPVNIFLTDDILMEGKIGIGDETYIVGLFAHVAGSKRNEPMVRIGNLAMIPKELIPTEEFGNVEAYLIEARSIGGLSGCPVFVRESFPVIEKNVFKTTGKHYLLGLMHAHWKLSAELKNDILLHWDFNEKVNMGIAVVIPAKKIQEVLNHPFLVGLRDQKEKEKLEKSN